MGKGGGCVPSKKRHPAVKADQPPTASVDRDDTATDSAPDPATAPASAPAPASVGTLAPTSSSASIKIFIVFYSMYGHVEGLAQRMKKGVDGIEGAEGVLYRVPETLSQDVLDQMKAPEKDASVPVITAEELVEADGVLFGFPASDTTKMAAKNEARGSAAAVANMRKRRSSGDGRGGGAGAGAGADSMLQFYTSDMAGLKMSPKTVLIMSIGFIFVVAMLHAFGKLFLQVPRDFGKSQ